MRVRRARSNVVKRDLCPQYFFGEFSADEINQFFVTPRGYVEVRQLKVKVVTRAPGDAASTSAGRHDWQHSPPHMSKTIDVFLKWPFFF